MKTVISALAALVLAGAGCKDNDNTRYDEPASPKAVESDNDLDRTRNDLDRAEDNVDRNTQDTQDDLNRAVDNIDRNTQGIQNDLKRAGDKIEMGAKRTGQAIKDGWNEATNRVDRDVDVDVKTGRDVDND